MNKNNKTSNLRQQDPFLQREQQRYEKPLPSREWISQVLEQIGVPLTIKKLAKTLSIHRSEFDFFERRIKAMVRDGQAYINRAGNVCTAEKLALIKCKIAAHKDGFGFAIPLNKTGQKDLVLYARQMQGLMNGDIVTVRPSGFDRKGRQEGQVLEIIERANTDVVARVYMEHGVWIAVPEDKRLSGHIILEASAKQPSVQSGQVVVVKITAYPKAHHPAMGVITEILGNYADSGMEIEIAVRKHHLPHVFSDACLTASKKIPKTVRKTDLKNRVDLRDLNLVTIDGETARDFDDAVFAEKIGRNFRLVVAIADVSHYVPEGLAIDIDAYERSTSVYFPRRVIPMLPEALSNGICSLIPEVDRLCMVCDMTITSTGNIKTYQFYPAVMHSKARLTYTQVAQWLESKETHPLEKEINTLHKLYQVLSKKRHQRGAMEFDGQETQMIFNDEGKIERIEPIFRNDAHRLIEECMLCANVCAAEFLLSHQHPALFRSHLGPTTEKLATLQEQLALVGLHLEGGSDPTPKDYAQLFTQLEGRADKTLLQIMLLRSMQQAVYEPNNQGHFGLAYDAYAHFTSPIRRYPDLLVHRAIKAVLHQQTYQPKHSWQEMGIHCSHEERRADEASKDVENWLKTYYMQDKIGEVFEGTISGLTGFGLFIMLDGLYTEGMIHISELGQDYFNFRPEIMAIEGERTKVSFKLGDRVVVKVARADLDNCRVELLLISGGSKGKTARTKTIDSHNTKQKESKKPHQQKNKRAPLKKPIKNNTNKSKKKQAI
ncbi:ribonuclease R [Neisseria sp. Ec49-e6-T10]|uniref:ribonuclease R n=1 Tax=Neisseria sp. Ec49-e6-T10 TaxID=3140744 RepID=UPI003EB6FD39